MKRTLLYFLLAFIAVILTACELNKTKPGKIIFDRVPFVYATINGQRELFLIDTGASTSMLDKKLCDEVKIYYMTTGLEVIGVDGTSIPLKTTGRIPFTLDSVPYSASFACASGVHFHNGRWTGHDQSTEGYRKERKRVDRLGCAGILPVDGGF